MEIKILYFIVGKYFEPEYYKFNSIRREYTVSYTTYYMNMKSTYK